MKAKEVLAIIDVFKKSRLGDITTIADSAGVNRSYLSKFINGNPEKEVTAALYRRLSSAFPGHFPADNKSNTGDTAAETIKAVPPVGDTAFMDSNTLLKVIFENSLLLNKMMATHSELVAAHGIVCNANSDLAASNLTLSKAAKSHIELSRSLKMDGVDGKELERENLKSDLRNLVKSGLKMKKNKRSSTPRIGGRKQ